MAHTREALVLVPRSSAPKRTRGAARAWYLSGSPKATLQRSGDGLAETLYLDLPIDVPSKPRTTQGSLWSPQYRNYAAWRDVFLGGVEHALSVQGFQFELDPLTRRPKSPLFSPGREYLEGYSKADLRPYGNLSVGVLLYTELKGDCDNRLKSVLDASNKWLYGDDSQIATGRISVLKCAKGKARVQILVQGGAQEAQPSAILDRFGTEKARSFSVKTPAGDDDHARNTAKPSERRTYDPLGPYN